MSQAPYRKAPPNRWIIIWLMVLTVGLFISIAGNAALVQAANDPPVKVYQARSDDVGAIWGTNSGTTISSQSYTSVIEVPTSNLSFNHPHVCTAIASVGADYTDGGGTYTVGLGIDNNNAIFTNTKREFEFTNNADNDPNFMEVTTLLTSPNISGTRTFKLMAKKNNAASANLTIGKASMTVFCFKKVIGTP